GSMMLNCETGYPCGNFGKIGLVACWRAWLLIIHRKRSENFATTRKNRRRPARAKPALQSQFTIVFPQWIDGNIRHNYRFATIHCSATRTLLGADGTAIDRCYVFFRKTRSRAMAHVIPIVTEQQHRTEHAGRLRFDQKHEAFENLAKRRICGKTLQNLVLSAPEFVLLLLLRIGFEKVGLKAGKLLRFVRRVIRYWCFLQVVHRLAYCFTGLTRFTG